LVGFVWIVVGFVWIDLIVAMIKKLLHTTILMCLFVSGFAPASTASSHPFPAVIAGQSSRHSGTEEAQSAFAFVNSIGVNTHLNYFDRTYGNFPFVERELRSLGVRHVRDGAHLQNTDYNHALYGRWIQLGKLGIRFDAVLDPRSNLGPLTPALLREIDDLSAHTIESFEGPNELDISGKSNWAAEDQRFQDEIYSSSKALSEENPVQIVGPSLANVSNGEAAAHDFGRFDEANLHPYPAGKIPSAVFPEQTALARKVFGDEPVVFTESGYHNAIDDRHDQPGVSEQAAAKYILRLFLEDFARGIPRTYLYELLDEAPNPGLADNQMHWGLIRADGSEKPAFVALKRLIEDLNDNSEPVSEKLLDWTLSEGQPTIHHLLLEKTNGEFDLVLWQEIPSYDTNGQRDIVIPPARTTLHLQRAARVVTVYEPVLQDGALRRYANVSMVPLQIPDHPLIVAIDSK
jgi:hypothetical protein